MGFNLQNWLQEKTADINPFDGGKTGQTVRAQRAKPAPAQTISRSPVQVGPAQTRNASVQQAAPQRNISVQPTRRVQPQVKVISPVMPKPQPTLQNDLIRRAKAGFEGVAEGNKNFVTQVAGGAKSTLQELAKTPERALRSVAGLPFAEKDQDLLTSNKVAGIPGSEGLAKVIYGDPIKTYQQQSKEFREAGQASENPMVRKLAPIATFAAPLLAAADATGLSGVSAGTAAVGKVSAPVVKKGLLETAKAAKEVNAKIEQVNPQVAELDNHVGLLRQQEQSLLSRGLAENNAALINNRKAQTDALSTRRSLTQGGYIAGPGAKGFKEAQARGEVFDGVDGRPRFEVDDSKSKIDKSKIGYQTPLNEILDHPQLFNDYPKLKDIKVTQDASNTGSFDLDTNEMRIGAYAKSPKKQVLHEVQHAIQKEEGFARGGDLENGWDNYQRLAGEAESRAVESRINMKPGERTIKPFYDSLDVPKEDLIIKNGDGPAMSIKSKEEIQAHTQQLMKQDVPSDAATRPAYTKSKFIQEFDEPEMARDIKTDIALQKSLENANTDVEMLVGAVSTKLNLAEPEARAYVKKVADQSGIDISTGYPTRVVKDGDVIKPLVDKNGNILKTEDIDTHKKKLPAVNGVDHAVIVRDSKFQRVYAYRDDKGAARTFIKQRNPDGSWGTLDKSDVPIRSNYNGQKIQRLADDATINRELLKAREDGITRGYIWVEGGEKGDVASLLRDNAKQKPMIYDPQRHYVEGGVVRDRTSGDVLGNYAQVGPEGVRVHSGKHMIDFGELNLNKIKNTNRSSYSTDRMIERMTKDAGQQEILRNLLVHPAQRGERQMRVEAAGVAKTLNAWEKRLDSAVAKSERKNYHQDVAAYVERKLAPDQAQVEQLGAEKFMGENAQDVILSERYGVDALREAQEYSQFLRATYDNLLNRINEVRTAWGYEEIPRRDDYLTHIQEINGKNPLLQTWDDLNSSIMGDVTDSSGRRGALPTAISSQSKEFKPTMKYNPFSKKRYGDDVPNDSINPLREYTAVALHNIHMTEPAALARGFETALRTADEMRMDLPSPKGMTKPQKELWDKTKDDLEGVGAKGRVTSWAQEQANTLSGKTASGDRWFIDQLGESGEEGVKTVARMGSLTSRAGILGNAGSVIAQTLSMTNVLPKVGPTAAVKGLIRTIADIGSDSATWKNSDAMVSRYTDANLIHRGKLRKVSDATGIPLKVVEQAMVTTQYNMFYQKALEDGLKGQKAIEWATRESGKVVPWRGIGDTAHLYNNKMFNNTFGKFLREPVEQTRHFWYDLSPSQKISALILYAAANMATEELTGRKYLPDPIASTFETMGDFANNKDDEEDTLKDNVIQGAQRFGSDAVSAFPLVAQAVNSLPQSTRQTVFGDDNDMGRYEGALAITSPVTNVIKGAADVINGKYYDAAGNILAGTVTGGGQIRKTMQGAEALAKGYTESAGGRIQAAISNDPYNTFKGLVFGKNALSEQNAFNKSSQGVLGEKQTERLKALPREKRKDFAENIQRSRANGTTNQADTTSDTAAGDLLTANKERTKKLRESMSEADYDIVQLSKKDREKLVASGQLTQKKVDGLMGYYSNKKKELGYDSSAGKAEKDKADTGWTDEYNAAKKDHDENSKNWSAVERANKDKELKRLDTKRHFSKDTTTLYAMSKADVYDYVSQAKDGKKAVDEIVRYGDKMVEAGLYKYNKFRDKNGNVLLNAPGTKITSGGRKSSGRTSSGKKTASKAKGTKAKKGKFEYKLDGFSKISSSNSKDLYDLMKMAKLKNGIS